AMNGARELHLLSAEVAVGVVRELLAENKDAVERCPQFVRHVGKELRLVLRREREFLGLLFERSAGLFNLLVLAFDFCILLSKLLGLQCKLLVGLLQLLLLG